MNEIVKIDAESYQKQYLKDLVDARELFYFFAWRDIIVRYKEAVFGLAWAVLRPLLTMLFFTLVFSKIAHLPSNNVSYPLFVLAGMLPWQLFSNTINDACNCLINNAHLISKVYFPRIIIPAAQMAVHLIDFLIGFAILLPIAFYMEVLDPMTLMAFPIFLIFTLLLCLGVGFWISALTVKYRDFRFIIPFVIQFGMFISPVGYGSFLIPDQWIWLFMLNPLVGIIDGFRWCFFGISYPYLPYTLIAAAIISIATLISGYFYFRKVEGAMGDII